MLAAALLLAAFDPHLALRVDPVVVALGGLSLSADVEVDRHMVVRAGAFAVDVPALLLPAVVSPQTSGMSVHEEAAHVAVLYEDDGFTIGPELYLYRLQLSDRRGATVSREAFLHVTGGYRWYLLQELLDADDGLERLFIEPWATVGLPVFRKGGDQLGGTPLVGRVVNWHLTVAVGLVLF